MNADKLADPVGEPPTKDRRRISYTITLDSAIRSASQVFISKDPAARAAANRVLAELQKLRSEMPSRRQDDGKYDRR